jgi:DNA helicase-2/ATP-dependent DNA helicase PcrA
MDVTHILDSLNPAQREAVCAPEGHVLVLAGAGSGKTRVLTQRIAWLIGVEHVSPWGILAVTFTNKAAAEMRGRVEAQLEMPGSGMWIGTFHGLAHRLLRLHWQEAGLPQGFQILDADDQYRLIRRTLRELALDESRWPPRQVQSFINARKDEGLRPDHLQSLGDPWQEQVGRVYAAYEAACARGGLVDFAELLLRAHELWLNNPALLRHYQERFRHILVDEFQDTNAIQYAWLRLLAGDSGRMFAVGDDDQSIYSWRGARIENMQHFERDFPGTRVVRLEQNYRSTGTILDAANALIAHNFGRLGKHLWTEGREGERIRLYAAFNELEEARFVVETIAGWVAEGRARSEVAILYRSNAQSRVLEEALLRERIPYRVYGGLRFFERAEIKDALAYLRLAANRDDDAAFERVVNLPTRGIGERTVQQLRQLARERGVSLWQAARAVCTERLLPGRALNALDGFLDLVEGMVANGPGLPLHERVEAVIESSGLRPHYEKEGNKAEARLENLDELVSAAREYWDAEGGEAAEGDILSLFLAHAALEAGERQADAHEDSVQLMTLHAAKGLEFPLVFLAGLEEGLFPHQMSVNEPGRLEEERRLCYVGMTRAMERLCLTYAENRRLHGRDLYAVPSRFIGEIPREYLDEVRLGGSVSMPLGHSGSRGGLAAVEAAGSGYRLGQRVRHPRFGEGVVLGCEGQGTQARVQVNFEAAGSKWLVAAYARLEAV